MTIGAALLVDFIGDVVQEQADRLNREVRERGVRIAVEAAQEVFIRRTGIRFDAVGVRVLRARDGQGIVVNLNPIVARDFDVKEAPSPDRRSGYVIRSSSKLPRSFFFSPRKRSDIRIPAERRSKVASNFRVLPSERIEGQAALLNEMVAAAIASLEDLR